MTKPFQIQTNVLLRDLTTFGIGGEAAYFVNAKAEEQVFAALGFAEKKGIDVFILGGGSNILVSDNGFDGLVLQIGLKGISETRAGGEKVLVTAAGGEDWDDFVGFCVAKNYAGIECLSGIPGFVGGTPIQNVGAYGQEVSESITSVRVFDRRKREIRVIENAACGFQYRRSIFNTTHRERFVVLSATYSLTPGGAPRITYADIVSEFEGREPTLTETRNAVCAIRKSKGMLVRQGGADSRSAGSFFKNPVIGGKDLELIKECADRNGLGAVPSYRVDRDTFKVPAAWLIERSGFKKGFTLGNAGLSTRHSLALTNRGKASAEDIIALKKMIEDRVFEMFGIALEPEPNLIGFSS